MTEKLLKKIIIISFICSILPIYNVIVNHNLSKSIKSAIFGNNRLIQQEKDKDKEAFASILQLPWLAKDKVRIYAEPSDRRPPWNVRVILDEEGYSYSTNTSAASVVLVWNVQKGQVNQQFKALVKKVIHPFKRIGYIPGTEQISMKTALAEHNFPYTPKSYYLPADKNELIDDSLKSPRKKFLLKGEGHGNIQLLNDTSAIDNFTFAQEMIENPFLINGYKFDISQHLVITGVNPLRVYVQDNVILRFFDKPYEKQLATIVQSEPACSSVIRHLNGTDSMSMKEMFSIYMKARGHDPEVIYRKMRDLIRRTLLSVEPTFVEEYKEYKPAPGQMFQHTRWDFFLKEDLDMYLIEVNDSPFLGRTNPGVANTRQRETSTSLLRLTGVLNPDLPINLDALELTSDICYSTVCKDCAVKECKLCFKCITPRLRSEIALAYREHNSNSSFFRILPRTNNCGDSHNTVLEEWYCRMCLQDKTYCTE